MVPEPMKLAKKGKEKLVQGARIQKRKFVPAERSMVILERLWKELNNVTQ